MALLDRLRDDPAGRDWYATQARTHGWSRAVLTHHLTTDLRGRSGRAPSTFTTTMPAEQSDLARDLLRDPYVLDFLHLSPTHTERDLEDALVTRLTGMLNHMSWDVDAIINIRDTALADAACRAGLPAD